MFSRRLAFRALLVAIAASAAPAAIAAQQPVTLPLHDTRTLVVVDAWTGFSPVSPTRSAYTLQRAADGSFAGTVQITVGAGLMRRDTSFAIRLSRAAADSLFRVLSDVPLQAGSYRPAMIRTDDYPSITADLTVGDSLVRFHTLSQGAAHVPWQVSAGGRSYVSGSDAIWSALGRVLGRMGGSEKRALVEAVRRDPEASCGHGWASGNVPDQRARYAAGEAWFAADSVVTVEGRDYRKYGRPRIVMAREISPYATYRGVTFFQEEGLAGPADMLYVPARSSCEVQPYEVVPRP